jgi:hypothetical protein
MDLTCASGPRRTHRMLGVRVPPSALVETATNKALTSNLLVGAFFVGEDEHGEPPQFRRLHLTAAHPVGQSQHYSGD